MTAIVSQDGVVAAAAAAVAAATGLVNQAIKDERVDHPVVADLLVETTDPVAAVIIAMVAIQDVHLTFLKAEERAKIITKLSCL